MRNLYITNATNAGNFCVDLVFNDNTQQRIDVGAFIHEHPHPQYNKYLNADLFDTFKLDDGNVVWGDSWDLIFPVEQLHQGHVCM